MKVMDRHVVMKCVCFAYHLFSFDSLHLKFLLLLGQGSKVFPPHFPATMRAEFVSHHNILHSKLIMLIALNEQYKS